MGSMSQTDREKVKAMCVNEPAAPHLLFDVSQALLEKFCVSRKSITHGNKFQIFVLALDVHWGGRSLKDLAEDPIVGGYVYILLAGFDRALVGRHLFQSSQTFSS